MRRAVVATHLRDEADVVDPGNRAIAVVFAAGEGDLELARQVVKIGMAQEISRDAQSVGGHVKRFAGANTRHRAGRDVAHGVTASLARGQARIGEQAHRSAHILEFHEMELNVFARGEVAAAGRVFVGNNRQCAKLRGRQHARGNLDAQHLEARLPLAIGAVLQPERTELFWRDGAALQLPDALFKTDDLRLNDFSAVPFFDFG